MLLIKHKTNTLKHTKQIVLHRQVIYEIVTGQRDRRTDGHADIEDREADNQTRKISWNDNNYLN